MSVISFPVIRKFSNLIRAFTLGNINLLKTPAKRKLSSFEETESYFYHQNPSLRRKMSDIAELEEQVKKCRISVKEQVFLVLF